MDYYTDAMENGPKLSGMSFDHVLSPACKKLFYPLSAKSLLPQICLSVGHLPIPANFTTVGKPAIYVNQYDNPIDVYSDVSQNQH